jgi:hypothetical protein
LFKKAIASKARSCKDNTLGFVGLLSGRECRRIALKVDMKEEQ